MLSTSQHSSWCSMSVELPEFSVFGGYGEALRYQTLRGCCSLLPLSKPSGGCQTSLSPTELPLALYAVTLMLLRGDQSLCEHERESEREARVRRVVLRATSSWSGPMPPEHRLNGRSFFPACGRTR